MLAAESRRRFLTDAQVIAVWHACEGRGSFDNVTRLLLLTGVRRGEFAKLTHDRILPDRLVLPAMHMKSGAKHEVPLTEFMRTVIAAQRP